MKWFRLSQIEDVKLCGESFKSNKPSSSVPGISVTVQDEEDSNFDNPLPQKN